MRYHYDTSNPHHFRCWFYLDKRYNRTIQVSFDWWTSLCGIGIDWDDEQGIGLFIGTPPLAFWLHLPVRLNFREDMDLFSLRFHDGAVWWKIVTPSHSWSCETPKWRDGCFNFVDFLLGKHKYTSTVLEQREVTIPMPEKAYAATAKLTACEWKRPRWFAKRLRRVEIECPEGVPFEGKGTASWNCGPDATFGLTTPADSIPEGVGKMVGSVLRDRVRYGGWNDWAWHKDAA